MLKDRLNISSRVLYLSSILLLLIGCNTVKYVPEDKYLLSSITIESDNELLIKEELASNVKQEENLKILGFVKFHLWLYNLSLKRKENGFFKRIGEPPFIYDQEQGNNSVRQLEQYLFNKGYYHGNVTDTVIFKGKKANLTYLIKSGEPYRIRNVKYTIKDQGVLKYLQQSSEESLIKTGDILDVDVLDMERTRITQLLQNDGFFKFLEEYVHYKIDTAYNSNVANVELIIENTRYNNAGNTETAHKKFTVGKYLIYIENPKLDNFNNSFFSYSDTTFSNNFTFFHNGKIQVDADLFIKSIEIKPGELYEKKLNDKTYNNLYALRQFKYINIQYQEEENVGDSLNGILTGKIFLPLQVKQNYSVDIEGTNTSDIEGSKTSANLGIAGNLNYQHKNLFGGAEIFDLSFKGATERQIALINNEKTNFNTIEYGGQTKLSIPGFILPINESKLNLYEMPFTTISFAYNFQERPDYTRTIVNATLGYQWKSSAAYNHTLNLFDLNAVQIFRLNPDFENRIKDLFIKSSYTDHIISSTSYTLIYNDQGLKKRPDYHSFRMNIEASGNTLWAASNILGLNKYMASDSTEKDRSSFFKIFNTRFAQYLKGDFDFRYGYRIDKYNAIATRAFLGLAYPYGNFHVIPFEKRYFSGGANGIRAWQVRSLGPGSYIAGVEEYPNQSADIKLEANLEYRFKLFWMFEGALFIDAGNIWAINTNDNRSGAVFNFNRFYNEIAVGSGMGLRLVYTYFIIRTDVGLKLRDPSQPIGQCWIPGTRNFTKSDLNFNIAIGYPF